MLFFCIFCCLSVNYQDLTGLMIYFIFIKVIGVQITICNLILTVGGLFLLSESAHLLDRTDTTALKICVKQHRR